MRTIVGVMGSGSDGDAVLLRDAHRLGTLIAEKGWVLLNGGRACGVMDASAKGAKSAGGLVVGVLPDTHSKQASSHLDIAIRTGMGDARDYVNVLSSDVVIAMRGGAGTLAEISLALKAHRTVIAVDFPLGPAFAPYVQQGLLIPVQTPDEAVAEAEKLLAGGPAEPMRHHV